MKIIVVKHFARKCYILMDEFFDENESLLGYSAL
jgi:hypothetical protein